MSHRYQPKNTQQPGTFPISSLEIGSWKVNSIIKSAVGEKKCFSLMRETCAETSRRLSDPDCWHPIWLAEHSVGNHRARPKTHLFQVDRYRKTEGFQ